MKFSKSITPFFTIILPLLHGTVFIAFLSHPHCQWTFFLSREEVKVLGEIWELTHPHRVIPIAMSSKKLAPSATVMSSGMPLEPLGMLSLTQHTVHVTGSYSEWLTLGLPTDLHGCHHLPNSRGIGANMSAHSVETLKCPLMELTTTSEPEHVGVLLQCCFCSWSSGSAPMMQEHLLNYHWKDDGSCMIVGLEPTPRATCH